MPISATAKDTGISANKMRRIIDLVRGEKVEDALHILQFLPSPAATKIAKVVKSAAANAENELFLNSADLRIVEIYANEGPSLKRFRARARGRANRIIKRNCHLTVVVDEQEL